MSVTNEGNRVETKTTAQNPIQLLNVPDDVQVRALNAVKDLQTLYDHAKQCDLSLTKVKEAYVIKCKEFLVTRLRILGKNDDATELSENELQFIFHKAFCNDAISEATFDNEVTHLKEVTAEKDKLLKIFSGVVFAGGRFLWSLFWQNTNELDMLLLIGAVTFTPKAIPLWRVTSEQNRAQKASMVSYKQWAKGLHDLNRDVKLADVEKDIGGLKFLYKATSK